MTVTTGAVTLVVGWRAGKHVVGGRVEVTDEVATVLREIADGAADLAAARDAKPYSGDSHLEDEEVFEVPAAAVPADNEIVGVVRAAAALGRISANDLPAKPLLFYAPVIGDDPDNRSGYVRTTNPVMSAGQGRILTRLRGSLTTLKEPVFSLDRRVDFIVNLDGLIVLNQRPFERVFRDLPAILDRIPEWLGEVTTALPLEAASLADLQVRCVSDTRLRRRLRSIHERGHLSTVTLDQIRVEATRQGIDPDKVIVDGMLRTTDIDAGTLLKLLNEDLMVGGLTGTRFEVDRKTPR